MGRNKDELIKLAEKITGQECKDVLTKKDALKKIACHYLGQEKEFSSIADCLECIVKYGATGGSGGGDYGKPLVIDVQAEVDSYNDESSGETVINGYYVSVYAENYKDKFLQIPATYFVQDKLNFGGSGLLKREAIMTDGSFEEIGSGINYSTKEERRDFGIYFEGLPSNKSVSKINFYFTEKNEKINVIECNIIYPV